MSTIMSVASTSAQSVSGRARAEIFHDLPLIDRATRLTVLELKNSDKQVVNELVYRWCRVLTRPPKKSFPDRLPDIISDNAIQNLRKILILDMMGSINPIRLATVLKRDDRRMRMIGITRGCKINSTYVTLNSHLGRQAIVPSSLKLVIIYHDEFFILKTLALIKEFLDSVKCHVVFIVPRLDRQEHDVVNLTSNYQILKCDFCVSRRQIGPAPPESSTESYQTYLNQIYVQRYPPSKTLPDRLVGELKDDRMYIDVNKLATKWKDRHKNDTTDGCGNPSAKRLKSESIIIKPQ